MGQGQNADHPRSIWRRIASWIVRLTVPVPKGKTLRSKIGWIGRRVVYWYLIILVMLAVFQRYLIYQPTRAAVIDPKLSGLEAAASKRSRSRPPTDCSSTAGASASFLHRARPVATDPRTIRR
jgi:hypothetical protein